MVSTMTARGGTVIPAPIRKAYNLQPATKLEWVGDGDTIRVIPLRRDSIAEARGLFRGSGLGKALLQSRREDQQRG